jgi:DNA-binding response OmpR family regulator
MLNVALYEDNDLMRALLYEWLSEAGYRVVPGTEPANLVIASVSSPRQAGLQQVREIQCRHPGVPVIAISAQARSGLSTAGAPAGTLGVRQVIAKPLAREELLAAVRAIIGTPA